MTVKKERKLQFLYLLKMEKLQIHAEKFWEKYFKKVIRLMFCEVKILFLS